MTPRSSYGRRSAAAQGGLRKRGTTRISIVITDETFAALKAQALRDDQAIASKARLLLEKALGPTLDASWGDR